MTRIQTTHVGSLPRSKAVTDIVYEAERGEAVDAANFGVVIGAAIDDVVDRQVAAGIDIVSDGEMSKISYATYIKDRITGFDGDSPRTPPRRPRGVPRLPRAAGGEWRDPDIPSAEVCRPGGAEDPRPAGRRPRPFRRGARPPR